MKALVAILGWPLPHALARDKVIVPFEKIRTRKKALRRVEEQLVEAVETHGALQATVIHANCEEEAREWMYSLEAAHPTVDFKLTYFGPVVGTHLGEGAIAIGWMKK